VQAVFRHCIAKTNTAGKHYSQLCDRNQGATQVHSTLKMHHLTQDDTIRYDMIGEFNVDSKVECIQLNLSHVARENIEKKKLKQTNASANLVQYGFRSVKAVRQEKMDS